jgi:hypothetical protein
MKKNYNKRLHENFNHFIPQITTFFVRKHVHYHKSNGKNVKALEFYI